jgi:hypothetical protein
MWGPIVKRRMRTLWCRQRIPSGAMIEQLLLSCKALSSSTLCRFIPALSMCPPSRPVEFHHQPLTVPYVSLSTHTARVGLPHAASQPHDYTSKNKLLPITRLTHDRYGPTHPLRSTLITKASSLLLDNPPPSHASILSPFVDCTYRVFSYHHMKSSYVPQAKPESSSCQLNAGCCLGSITGSP